MKKYIYAAFISTAFFSTLTMAMDAPGEDSLPGQSHYQNPDQQYLNRSMEKACSFSDPTPHMIDYTKQWEYKSNMSTISVINEMMKASSEPPIED